MENNYKTCYDSIGNIEFFAFTKEKRKMEFLSDDIKKIAKRAVEKTICEKLQIEGYYDASSLIGSGKINKAEISSKLRKLNSPLANLYGQKYAKNPVELKEKWEVLNEKISKNESFLAEDEYFAIIYYILRAYKTRDMRLECIMDLCRDWNTRENKDGYDIRTSNGIIFDAKRIELHVIPSMRQYVDFLGQIKESGDKLFFRGHSNVSYDLKASLFRKEEWLSNEKKMYLELMAKCPSEFEKLGSHIEKLAEMQHYGLPTRLLDVTQNPLIALYFACEDDASDCGEIIIFSQSVDKIKYFQSDTVAMLASLPLFTKSEQRQFYQVSSPKSFNINNFNNNVERLVHEVRMERPGFKSEIRPDDLRDAIICIPARKNRRIDNQEGAFVVCGLLGEIYGSEKYNTLSRLRLQSDSGKTIICIINRKDALLNELDRLGINKAKVYPEIDDVADYIKTHVNKTV